MRERTEQQRGSVVILAAAFVAVAMLLVFGLGRLGGAAVARARARSAADAAALAGAAEGRSAAEAVAVANGGSVVGWEQLGTDVRVAVELDDAQATARARRMPPPTRGWPDPLPTTTTSVPTAQPCGTAGSATGCSG